MEAVALKDFIDEHGAALGEKIEKELTPIYDPSKEDPEVLEYEGKIDTLLRAPFPVQGEVIKGMSKAMYKAGREKLFISGEMGTGKTFLALAIIAMSPRPIRAIVVCPGHLTRKWCREAKKTIPNVKTVDISVRNVISVLDSFRSENYPLTRHEVWVISKERLKLSCGWEPAYNLRKQSFIPRCPDCGEKVMDGEEWLTIAELHKKKRFCDCGSALWQSKPKPRRYAPMEYIKKYLNNRFHMVIGDEIHETKSGHSLIGHGIGILTSVCKYFLGLTGTLSGGYADNVYYLNFRIEPHRFLDHGYYGADKFQKKYGVIEEVRKIENIDDHSHGRIKKNNLIICKRPGVSPEVVGKYFLDKTCFIRLCDIKDALPPYNEYVHAVEMDTHQSIEYHELESKLREAVKQYKSRASSAMLQSLLSYPDSCVAFEEMVHIKGYKENSEEKEILLTIEAPLLSGDRLLPKEIELIELIKDNLSRKRKVLVYVAFTGNRDIRPRLVKVLEKNGFRVGVLSDRVKLKDREEWIENNHHKFDCLITNPELVKTGLDLIMFPTIAAFQSGYNVYTNRQASRRSWRIGQSDNVEVHYFCYADTMQEIAINLIAKKLETALLVEGDLPEGLASYQVEGGSMIEEMTKALVEGRKYTGAETSWANLRKLEIESQLGMNNEQTVFNSKEPNKRPRTLKTDKTTVIDDTVINITVMEGRRKKVSKLTVKFGDLDEELQGKAAQFHLF